MKKNLIDYINGFSPNAREIIDRYDHRYLNDLMDNPTAELLAQEIGKTVEASGLPITRIRLWETANCMVEVTLS